MPSSFAGNAMRYFASAVGAQISNCNIAQYCEDLRIRKRLFEFSF
jgi:hypothetical protein